MEAMGWRSIDLIKMDIEGFEGVLLRYNCEWLEQVRALCLELHKGVTAEDLREVAARWRFSAPRQRNGIWLIERRPG